MHSQELRQKISALPRSPGVYFMKDSQKRVIYVGKAKDLRSRVSSYFVNSRDHSPKTRKLVSQIDDFEVMLVKNEVEALLLERTLIKHHLPQFNILLRDDKEYPYIRVHFGDEWPRLDVVRRRKDDGAEYFGPFSAPGSLRQGLEAVRKVFPIIRCSPWEFKNATRVCNYYHMKLCLGPCVKPVDPLAYKAMLRDAMALLNGKNQEVLNTLNKRMQNAAEFEHYELAAQYRDQIRAIESLQEKQSVVMDASIHADIIARATKEDLIVFHVLGVRSGLLLSGHTFTLQHDGPSDDGETLSQFILQYYDGRDLPPRIVVLEPLENAADLAQALASQDQKTSIQHKKHLHKVPWQALADIAARNAEFQLDETIRVANRSRTSLEALQATLNLSKLPVRMECIDISNFQETAIVASDVCFINGNPEKSLYRSYNIQTVSGAPDDFASIFEVVKRRLERGVRDNDLPDLLVIDGGRGQLDSALKAQAEFPGLDVTIVSLAKSRLEKSRRPKDGKQMKVDTSTPRHSLERVFKPGLETPIPLAPGSPSHRLLTRIRDEAHRFAITKHRSKRSKIAKASPLDHIPGIGPKIRSQLVQEFGSLENIARASMSDLTKIRGVSEELAIRIHASFADK